MGILNVTPDSFSDGGQWLDSDRAIAHGLAMRDAGGDLVDVGGESTRPGASRPDLDTELDRVVPVITALVSRNVTVSIDTMRAEVAHAGIEAGASVVNDVSGGLADSAMLPTVAKLGAALICMHWRAHSATMQTKATYADVVAEVSDELAERVRACDAAGIDPTRVALDPGIGFAKNTDHNWRLLAHLDELHQLGRPVVVGASRKAFLGALLAEPAGIPRIPTDRDDATTATTTLAAVAGAWCVRVHDVRRSRDAVAVAQRWATDSAVSLGS